MFEITEYNDLINLTKFYKEAEQRGFYNNASKKMLIDSISNEQEWNVWLLYYNKQIVGTTAAHSLDIMGKNCYRIAARSCVFTDKTHRRGHTLRKDIVRHQNPTSQFLIPACIEWKLNSNLYITSNEHEQGTQRQVHKIFCPALEKSGCLTREAEKQYRGHKQTFWKLNIDVYYKQLIEFGRWPIKELV
jgi:hypothetical protein